MRIIDHDHHLILEKNADSNLLGVSYCNSYLYLYFILILRYSNINICALNNELELRRHIPTSSASGDEGMASGLASKTPPQLDSRILVRLAHELALLIALALASPIDSSP